MESRTPSQDTAGWLSTREYLQDCDLEMSPNLGRIGVGIQITALDGVPMGVNC